ncbi:CDP-glycerol glycerophosphotransferase family protein [Colwellia asteriadis]
MITWLLIKVPHRKKYYIFSSKYGFTDNTKYLFLYYLKQGHHCVWVSSDQTCYQDVKYIIKDSPHSKVVKRNSGLLLIILARAKYIFVTHSLFDLAVFSVKSCPVVNLWHGIPIKKMGYDSNNDIALLSLNYSNPYTINDFVISSSEATKPFLVSCMNIQSAKVLPLGQPRNDFLYQNKNNDALINKLKACYSEKNNSKVFVYAPTFRDHGDTSLLIYRDLITSFSKNAQESDMLILRLHPKERELVSGIALPSNVALSLISDVQEELLIADVLISDYSSIILDFSILSRPIILYTPDKDNYFANRGGSYFNYNDIIQGCVHVNNSELNSTWQKKLKSSSINTQLNLHVPNSCKALYDRFN